MANNDNPVGQADDNPQGSVESQQDQASNGSVDTNPKGPTEAERKLQSERDSLRETVKKLEERVDEVTGSELDRLKTEAVNTFLGENKDKFPDLDTTDFAFATSPEDFEKIAKKAQDRMDRVRNKALEDAHAPQENSLTDEEVASEVAKLEKDDTPQRGAFQKFLSLQQRRKR